MKIRHHPTSLVRTVVLALVLGGAPLVAATTSAEAAAPSCGITWGSLAKTPAPLAGATAGAITNVRSGGHACFDRLVIDLSGRGGASSSVRYVNAVLSQGQGAPVPLRGGAKLEIVVRAPDYDVLTGLPIYRPASPRELTRTSGLQTFRQVASGGSFEAVTTIGVGVRARLPMRAFVLAGPGGGSRLVVDVAHHW